MKITPFLSYNISQLGKGVQLPDKTRNFCKVNDKRINDIARFREDALVQTKTFLKSAKTEEQVVEGLFVLDRMLDNGVKGIDKLYPTLSRFNDTTSPNIQVMLAGIYRKTLVPDAFGPLNKMLYKQITNPNSPYFDATEEIGGAVLEYITNYKPHKQPAGNHYLL